VSPFRQHFLYYLFQFYWGTEEILVPVFQKMEEAFTKHPDVTVVVNFASFRSVYTSVMEILNYSEQIKTIAIIAEGVPESQTRAFNKEAHKKGVGIIGPATVGGIKVRGVMILTTRDNSLPSHMRSLLL
jgi:ATP citrate (pro-S)-lyase